MPESFTVTVPVGPASLGDPLPEDGDAAAVELVRRHAFLTSALPPRSIEVRVCQATSGGGVRKWVMSAASDGRVRYYEVTSVGASGEYRLDAYMHYDHVLVYAGKGARDA